MSNSKAVILVSFFYFFGFIIISHCRLLVRDENNPKMVFSVFRHGARSPIKLIPNDPYNDQWMKIGLEELTNVGKRQQITNGQLMRARYDNHIGPYYKPTEFYIQSTDPNRCVMSGQSFVAGLFRPQDYQIWSTDTLGSQWQPVPVFTTNIANNWLVLAPLVILIPASGPILYRRHKEIINAISKATGTLAINFWGIYLYADALICEMYEGVQLPHGLEAYKDQILPFMSDVMDFVMTIYGPLLSGSIRRDIMKRVQSFRTRSSAVKTNVYSMSDIHVASLMSSLVTTSVGQPQFCASIYLEMYGPDETMRTDYFMIWYRPKLTADVTPAYIKGCGYKCPYFKFRRLLTRLP